MFPSGPVCWSASVHIKDRISGRKGGEKEEAFGPGRETWEAQRGSLSPIARGGPELWPDRDP